MGKRKPKGLIILLLNDLSLFGPGWYWAMVHFLSQPEFTGDFCSVMFWCWCEAGPLTGLTTKSVGSTSRHVLKGWCVPAPESSLEHGGFLFAAAKRIYLLQALGRLRIQPHFSIYFFGSCSATYFEGPTCIVYVVWVAYFHVTNVS